LSVAAVFRHTLVETRRRVGHSKLIPWGKS
jgi:hypothetical protein